MGNFCKLICMDCLERCEYVLNEKGTLICQNCYHKRYSKRKFVNHNIEEKTYNLYDLKNKWERNY